MIDAGTTMRPTLAGNTPGMSSSANVTGKPSGTKVNFCTLFTPGGKRVAYLVVANYVKNTWDKYEMFPSMFSSSTGLFSFQFKSMDGLDAMLENEDVGTVPIWVKLHGVHVIAFNEDGLSAIATKLGTPLMLDSYTSDMCMQLWGRSSYARAMIELRADVELKDNIVAAMPKITREGYYTCNIRVEYEWNPLSTTPIIEKINKIEKFIIDRKVTLVDDERKRLEKVVSLGDYDSEDEVASGYNEMACFLAKKDGYGTQSLLEQWKESYVNDDYEYDPYDDDMYEGQEFPDKLQTICNNLDIIVRSRRKK
ncbi:putative reverse transcriptase domain-containing protein [Tanacetum coccineum]